MRPDFHEYMLQVAEVIAQRSRDPSSKFGCVIVRPDKSIASTGYNGFPRGMKDLDEWWTNRDEKYERVLHSEMNALLHLHESAIAYTLYVSGPPCVDCAKHIAAAGIHFVYYRPPPGTYGARWNIQRPLQILKDSGVAAFEIDPN